MYELAFMERLLYARGPAQIGAVEALPNDPTPSFVADKMLGRLARWLRLVGCDVLYGTNFSGRGLVHEARRSGRTVLTRDRRIVKDPDAPPHLFIERDRVGDQLRQVVDAFAIDPFGGLFSRCVSCNAVPVDAEPATVADEVPAYVLMTQPRFRRCPRCRHVYWDGTHLDRVRGELRRMGFASAVAEEALVI
ncbi:MAG: uncharacterized protein QOD06_248 [Candidatus Binatota bacterium]|nr:uncharacterized protein [Candidatus Binatota bacterium]